MGCVVAGLHGAVCVGVVGIRVHANNKGKSAGDLPLLLLLLLLLQVFMQPPDVARAPVCVCVRASISFSAL